MLVLWFSRSVSDALTSLGWSRSKYDAEVLYSSRVRNLQLELNLLRASKPLQLSRVPAHAADRPGCAWMRTVLKPQQPARLVCL